MRRHGVHFQPPLSGALHVARTNAFFMGGGKALVNAYFRSAEKLGVRIRYDTPVVSVELDGDRFVAACTAGGERIEARSCVLAAGGFESNREWLREAWGQNERGEWPSDNFLIRGTRFNKGVLLKSMIDAGADSIGDPTQAHMVAIDARAPLYDGGICTRIDCVSLGVVVNREGAALLRRGRGLLAQALCDLGPAGGAAAGPDRLLDHRPEGDRPLHAAGVSRHHGEHAGRTGRQAGPARTGLRADRRGLQRRLPPRHASTTRRSTTATPTGLTPAKTHWARPIDTPPYYGYALKPGVTFTYLGLKVNDESAVHFGGRPSPNLFVAGEMMAGNVLGKGYTAGVGMAIGTAFGRIAGTQAAAGGTQGDRTCSSLKH